jgi:hypothetical protein
MPAAFPVRWQFDTRIDTANKRLAVALAVSLVLHVLGYATWRVAPAVTAAVKSTMARIFPNKISELQPRLSEPPAAKREVPLVFVEVDPALAAVEPPRETKNYSTHNSLAANPQPKNLDLPKIDGAQKNVLRTADIPKPQPQPLQPAPTPESKPAQPKQAEANPKPQPEVGDLAMAKIETKPLPPKKGDGEQTVEKPLEKPRTVREAMARNAMLAGRKVDQEAGVPRRAPHIALDAKGSPFGNYDAVFIGIVQERWYALLDNSRFTLDQRGKVSITFRLHYDGRITNVETDEKTVDDIWAILCQKAILDPAPFPKWPIDMRRLVGNDTREVRFTFYYD